MYRPSVSSAPQLLGRTEQKQLVRVSTFLRIGQKTSRTRTPTSAFSATKRGRLAQVQKQSTELTPCLSTVSEPDRTRVRQGSTDVGGPAANQRANC